MIKTGENVRDGQGNSYQLGQLLGRGLWGKSYVVRRESDETLHVLKVPLSPDDFRGEVPGAEAFFAACREAVLEQARLYEQAQFAFLPRLEDRFTLPDGQPALVLPRYPESLERRLGDNLPLYSLLETLLQVSRLLRELAAGPGLHGGLRPSNILFSDRGEVILSDLATPAVRKHFQRLAGTVPGGQPFLPPELAEVPGATWGAGADTYALAMMVWRGVVAGEARPPWPRNGLDKAAQVALKDRVVERMKLEDSNPRFHARLAERLAVLLSRALSRETSPSPPYRFPRLDEMQARLEEVQLLIRPQVSSVGKVMLDRTAAKPWFMTDEDVAFSTTVGCSAGVEGQEEIGVGIAVFDLDRDIRMKDLALGYSVDRHPSGRYRFNFTIGGLGPGRYRGRLAFAVRDSGQQPATTECEFNVRAAPGWVPRAEPPVPSPLPLRPDPVTVTQLAPAAPAAPQVAAPQVAAPPAVPAPSIPVPTRPAAVARPPEPVPVAPAARPLADTPPTEPPDRPTLPRPIAPAPKPAVARPAPPPTIDLPPTAPPPPYAPGPKPPVSVRDRQAFDDRSVTVVPVAGTPEPDPSFEEDLLPDDLEPLPGPAVRVAPPVAFVPTPAPAPPPPPEPTWKARDWSQEALPIPSSGRNLDAEDDPPPPEDDDDAGPNPLARIWSQLRNDPYIAVMAGLGLIILVLLLVFLLLRK